jgi:hypothetical protein
LSLGNWIGELNDGKSRYLNVRTGEWDHGQGLMFSPADSSIHQYRQFLNSLVAQFPIPQSIAQ